ncbi:trehalose-6-phosphate synthase [Sphingobacterium multivorum]|uniref:trehalose-6-phosphate synthase n=1 Tax=Sphingobacterium multivorum TaxID=28454 RepID=UPI0021154362|nr:trehalose-6-phosphate synthase [Sphingobacterium multivorum]
MIINPYNRTETADSIYQALKMPPEEVQERTDANIQIIQKFNVQHWVQLFTNRLAETKASSVMNGQGGFQIKCSVVFGTIPVKAAIGSFSWIMTALWSNSRTTPKKQLRRPYCTTSWIILFQTHLIPWSS